MVYDINGNAIANMSSVAESKRFRILEYNISNYSGDGSFDGYSGNDLPGYIASWAQFIGSTNADICLLTENRLYIDEANTTRSDTALLSQLYNYVTDYPGPLDNMPWRVTLLSNEAQENIVSNVFDHQIGDGGSKYTKAVINLNGVEVCVVIVHMIHSDTSDAAATRAQQMGELISMTSQYDNTIIGGDFNTRSLTEIDVMKQAGFTFGNGGLFGDYLTQPRPTPTYPVDNVCVRGPQLKMQSFSVLTDCILSDHYPTITDIIVG